MQYLTLLEAIPIQENKENKENKENQEDKKDLVSETGLSNWILAFPAVELIPGPNTLVEDMLEQFQKQFKTSSFLIHPIKRTLMCVFREPCHYIKPEQLVLYKHIGCDDIILEIDPDFFGEEHKIKAERKVILKNKIKQFLFKHIYEDENEEEKIKKEELNILFLYSKYKEDDPNNNETYNVITINMTENLYNALVENNINLVFEENKLNLNTLQQLEDYNEQCKNLPILENKQDNMIQYLDVMNNIEEQNKRENP